MKAARLVGPKKFEVLETETPVARDGQCLIKLKSLSVCGSDIRHEYGTLFPEEHYPLDVGMPCHECAGVVVESRCQEYQEGQRVIVFPPSGRPGGLVEYLASDPALMCLLPQQGDLSEWVMCQPSATVLYSCQKMGSVLGKDVAILGQGAIGLSFTMIVSRLGARKVICIDPLDYRLDWSRQMGATDVVNPDRESVTEAVESLTEGRGADIVVEAAGYQDTLNMTFRIVRQFGMIMAFGVQGESSVMIDHPMMMSRQPTIIPTTGGRIPDPMEPIRTMVALKDRGWIDPGQLVTHRLAFEEVQRAFDIYEGHLDDVIKAVLAL